MWRPPMSGWVLVLCPHKRCVHHLRAPALIDAGHSKHRSNTRKRAHKTAGAQTFAESRAPQRSYRPSCKSPTRSIRACAAPVASRNCSKCSISPMCYQVPTRGAHYEDAERPHMRSLISACATNSLPGTFEAYSISKYRTTSCRQT